MEDCGKRERNYMENKISFRYSYRMKGHDTLNGIDGSFYYRLPEHDVIHENSKTGKVELSRPDIEQLITVIGTAVLSSSAVAATIKAWLDSRKCKITISIDGTNKKVEYEGPKIKQNLAAIKMMIDQLAEDAAGKSLRITAEHLPENQKKR
jgi:hypothetical protein